MEETESTTRDRTTGHDGNQAADNMLLMSSKPLHRFVQKEPKSLGIAILIFGCAEILMGFLLAKSSEYTSYVIYTPFWQGALLLLCGNLSIYTEIHPSKKMVTVCLAMYVVSLLGLVISIGQRISIFGYLSHFGTRGFPYSHVNQLFGIEVILFTSSLCVSVLLIFLCAVARLALKSTRTQVIIQHIQHPLSETTSN